MRTPICVALFGLVVGGGIVMSLHPHRARDTALPVQQQAVAWTRAIVAKPTDTMSPLAVVDDPTARKYAVLLESISPSLQDSVGAALRMRESAETPTEVADAERKLSWLLHTESYELYEKLRESNEVQDWLTKFAEQLPSASQLGPDQHRALLLAKLDRDSKSAALQLEAETRADQPGMEDAYARDIALSGLDHYRQAFITRAREVLTEEQWASLNRFESQQSLYSASTVTPGEREATDPL